MKSDEYITDAQVVKRARAAVRLELEKKKAMDLSFVGYDNKTQVIYKQNADGSKIVLGNRLRKGRYSERITKKA